MQSSVSGLAKGTTYHARLVARNDDGLSLGADTTFTTPGGDPDARRAVAAAAWRRPPAPATRTPTPTTGPRPCSRRPRRPSSARASASPPQAGSVLVRLPGSSRAVALTDAASVPVGSILDARKGTVTLQRRAARRRQPERHLPRRPLRGPPARRRPRHDRARAARPAADLHRAAAPAPPAASGRRPPRVLWGRDDHGRFRTRGSNSVATVRGTAWYVEDRCDGTLTRVSKGSVSVRDLRRQRTVIVNAGKSYLARSAR